MTEPRGGPPWPGRGGEGGQKPPWWPEDQPFPLEYGDWGRIQRRIMRRVLTGLAVLIAIISVVSWGAFSYGSRWHNGHWGGASSDGPPWFVPPVFVAALIIIARFVVRRIRRAIAPVADVMDAADRLAGGDYSVRISPRGNQELRNLGASFNRMAERLGENEVQRRALFADIAHELRTPLAIIQGNVEGMIDGVYARDDAQLQPVLEQTKVMARLLDDLRTLSVAEARELRLHREGVAPAVLVHDVAETFRPRAEERGVELTIAAGPLPEIEVDPMRMRQVLDNLVANALRYAPPGGWVKIETQRHGRTTRFSVSDNGPGIAPAQLEHVFDRFVKAADSGGSGLGLAIAKSLVEAHGGTISVESAAGSGATFHVDLTPVPG